MACTMYCEKIEEIFDAMIRLAKEVLPGNRRAVNSYINSVWEPVTVFVQSIEKERGLNPKFESYIFNEEERLRKNFEDLNYRIDGSDIIQVISGDRRLETVTPALRRSSFHDPDTNPLPDTFSDVLPRFKERFGKDQYCSESGSFPLRAA